MEIVRVEGVRVVFGTGEQAVVALDGVDLVLQAGELMALLGPSGSGKTTLLLCLSMIQEATAGVIVVNGHEICRGGFVRGVDPRRFRRENIGFVFQGANLVPFLTALDNVVLAMEIAGVRRRDARRRAAELLDYLEVGNRADALAPKLSGGERQRVAIARALGNDAKLVLADEPTANLDTERGFKVVGLLKKIAKERGAAVIVVTHDERMVAGFDTTRRSRIDPDQLRTSVQRFGRAFGLLRDDVTPCGVDVPIVHAHALMALLHDTDPAGMRVSCLHTHLQVDLSNVSRLAVRMEEAGHVHRRPCADDARAVRLVLTSEGRSLAERIERRSRARFARILDAIDPSEQPGVLAALDALVAAIHSTNLAQD
jgi:putative ABC transport system ATP-binding protein